MHGRLETPPVPFGQNARDYVEQFHSTASLARELMPPDEAERFDEEILGMVRRYASDGVLRMEITATVVWGRPVTPAR